jgi:hypothetical protein
MGIFAPPVHIAIRQVSRAESAGEPGHVVVGLDEEAAVLAAEAYPAEMERRRLTYPMRMPLDVEELSDRLVAAARGPVNQDSMEEVLSEVPPEGRRWLAAYPELVNRLSAGSGREAFAAAAARLMADVPDGVQSPAAARDGLVRIAARVLHNPAIAAELLLRGTRLVIVPRQGDIRSLAHSPSRWPDGVDVPAGGLAGTAFPPAFLVAEESVGGVPGQFD